MKPFANDDGLCDSEEAVVGAISFSAVMIASVEMGSSSKTRVITRSLGETVDPHNRK